MNNAPAARLGLSDREAARQAGVTHKAIAKAKATGRLAVLADGSISPDGIAEWQRNRRSLRGGHHTPDARAAAGNRPAKVPAAQPVPADDDDEGLSACTIAAMAGVTGDNAAEVLIRAGLPPEQVQVLAAQIHAAVMAEAAAFADEEWPAADGCATWGDHAAFDPAWPDGGSDWDAIAAGAGNLP